MHCTEKRKDICFTSRYKEVNKGIKVVGKIRVESRKKLQHLELAKLLLKG